MQWMRLVGCVLACGIGTTGALASDGNGKAPAKAPRPVLRSPTITIEELTITARKRAESVQEAPVAVTALGAGDLQDLDVRRISDIAQYVPNLALDSTVETSSASRVQLRGVGNGDGIASLDPGVGLYVDGVYVARSQGALLGIFDLERVEALRGPQGTLFGKNTIGGAVSVVTRKPVLGEQSGMASVRVGNYDRFDTRLALNVPLLAERAAMRLNLATATRDGFVKNKGSGSDLSDDKMLAFRAQLLFLPTENTELLLGASHSLEDRKPEGTKCKVSNPFSFGQNAQNRPDLLATGTEYRSASTAAALAQQLAVNDPTQQLANLAAGVNPYLAACAEDAQRDTRSVASDLSYQQEDLKTFASNATFTWDLGPGLTFRSITGWRRQELDQARDFDGTNLFFTAIDSVDAGREQQDQISQELQLIGDALDGRLSYVAGLYFLREKATDRGYRGVAVGQTFFASAVPGDLTTITLLPSTFESNTLQVNNEAYAAFGQGTYRLTDRLSATLGLRLTRERKRIKRVDVCADFGIDGGKVCQAAGQVAFAFEGSSRFKDLSPIATLRYAFSPEANAYVTWTRGFKSGGYNGRADTASLTNVIDDENLTSYEVGFKSLLYDNRLQINGAAFFSAYDGIQLPIPQANPQTNAFEALLTNGGRAEIRGAELEIRAVPFAGLELSSAMGVTRARYVDFDASPDPSDPRIPDDPEDRRIPNTPSYTLNLGATHQLSLGSFGNLRTHFDWTHIGRSGTDVNDSRILRKGKHGELDGQITWLLPDGRTEVALWGKNLLDREFLTNGIDLGASFGNALLIYNAPLTYGVELRRTF